jgi:hypothetical protein
MDDRWNSKKGRSKETERDEIEIINVVMQYKQAKN